MPRLRPRSLILLLLLMLTLPLTGCDLLPTDEATRTGELVGRSSSGEGPGADRAAEADPPAPSADETGDVDETGGDDQEAGGAAAPAADAINRIAFIGPDRNIYTISPDGEARAALTLDARRSTSGVITYQHLTWAPDSSRVSFVRLAAESGDTESALLTAPAGGGTLNELFVSSEIFPFYMLWSPDSSWISFLSNAPGEGSIGLYLSSPAGGSPTLLDQGQPFYWAWSPDSSRLFIHTGARDDGRLAILSPDVSVDAVDIDLQPTAFQAPTWSPRGDALLLAIEREEGDALVLIDEEGGIDQELAAVGGHTAFTMSPDGRHVAFIEGRPLLGAGTIGTLRVVDIDNPGLPLSAPEQLVLTSFWSPDSTRLVYFAIDDGSRQQAKLQRVQNDEQLSLSMYVLNVLTGNNTYLGNITPTEQFLNVVPYYDQYHGSATIWSPDGRSLVVPSLSDEGIPQLWIYDVDSLAPPRLLDEGLVAFWSWR